MKPRVQPFLRWAGSKRQLLPILAEFWKPEFGRYVEPFMGSACFFFALNPARALLADINGELIRTFATVRDRPRQVARQLQKTPVNRETFYGLRERSPKGLADTKAAARFIYLNRFCFNGLYRTNLAGKFNVPFAPTGAGKVPSEMHLCECSEVLSRADLHCGDFESTLRAVEKGDFVYMDPPFAVNTRRVFREYSPDAFTIGDLDRLADQMNRLDTIGAHFVVSYADCPDARRVFKRWNPRRTRTRRNIAGFAVHRRHAYELIAANIS